MYFEQLHCVSRNVPPLICYNFDDTHERILIFFGRYVTHKVGNQKTFYLSSQITCASAVEAQVIWGGTVERHSALPGKTGDTKIAFSLKCCISTLPEINQSLLHFFNLVDSHSYSRCCIKAKFHYASWFGASSELAPNIFGASSELASVMEFGFNSLNLVINAFSLGLSGGRFSRKEAESAAAIGLFYTHNACAPVRCLPERKDGHLWCVW